jgi:hypothetical protein
MAVSSRHILGEQRTNVPRVLLELCIADRSFLDGPEVSYPVVRLAEHAES